MADIVFVLCHMNSLQLYPSREAERIENRYFRTPHFSLLCLCFTV